MRGLLIAVYRLRTAAQLIACLLIFSMMAARLLVKGSPADPVTLLLLQAGVVVFLLAALLCVAGPRLLTPGAPLTVRSPVSGRWLAHNSPATAVPSHGIRAYGQTYAIDLAFDPGDVTRPLGPFPPASAYAGFGRPVRAMTGGVVVRTHDGQRDHRGRNSAAAVWFMLLEGAVRELGGPRFILGNHVVVRGDDGVFSLVAHLRRGRVAVREGQRVEPGDLLGECGNSGNSSEPHVHAQLMDRRSPLTAIGVPMAFADVRLDDGDEIVTALPVNGGALVA